ncbi:MAG: AI-2E family transporter [Acidimicrobiia bacterium]|nr:AI-2E family transporter [Acidimicrobiia bacterium]
MASVVIVVVGLKTLAGLVGPIFLAVVIVIVVSPVQDAVLRRGGQGWVAKVVLMVVSFGILALIMGSLVWATVELVELFESEEYASELEAAQQDVTDLAEELGIDGDDLEGVLDGVDVGAAAGQLTSALSGVAGLLSSLGLLLATIFFTADDSSKFQRSLRYVADQRPAVVEALNHFAAATRSYFLVSSIFGLIVAIFDVVALLVLGIPLALVWGILSFITNYIPNVGFVIGLIPPALLAFVQGGWTLSLWVIVIYSVINVVIQSVIQPKFVGDAVGLSATLTFLSLIFWSWVIGPLGALLAVPLTLLAKALLIDIDPAARWATALITLEEPPPD